LAREAWESSSRPRHLKLKRIVALKMIKTGAFASLRDVQLFKSEAEAIAALDHPNIVPILETGEHEDILNYSMKLIDGQTLQQSLPRFEHRHTTIAQLVSRIASAIHHAHERGVLHRDLKPSDILVDATDEPHVIDFGLGKRLGPDNESAGLSSSVPMGTPSYMSPEQAQGLRGKITIATDVYGLGGILYTLLTGDKPFQSDTVQSTIYLVIHADPRRPRTLNSKIPPDLETICLKCLEKDPQSRYVSARELAADLDRWSEGKPILARPASHAERAWKYARVHLWQLTVASLFLIMFTTGIGGIIWQWRQAVDARKGLRSRSSPRRKTKNKPSRARILPSIWLTPPRSTSPSVTGKMPTSPRQNDTFSKRDHNRARVTCVVLSGITSIASVEQMAER
jgi:eukaryotic-like serine/threonine-protein kinase